jgi:hypothetical protein
VRYLIEIVEVELADLPGGDADLDRCRIGVDVVEPDRDARATALRIVDVEPGAALQLPDRRVLHLETAFVPDVAVAYVPVAA